MILSQITQKRKRMEYCLWGTRELPQNFFLLPEWYRVSSLFQSRKLDRVFARRTTAFAFDIANIPDTQERVLCLAIYTRRSLIEKREKEKERNREIEREKEKERESDVYMWEKYMPLTWNECRKELLYVKLEPTLSCISPKHRDPRGWARGSAPEDMQQSPLMTPKSSCRVPLLRGREYCYLGEGGCVPFNRACHSLHPLRLKQKEDVLAVFVKKRIMKIEIK